ncbi:MAG TPA: uridine kinase [Oligoflexia bacterium]|nr:uridine kinase [Oligoflexia bacterium]HMP47433.1 uridine kinase [Oligoflexia bacterium]
MNKNKDNIKNPNPYIIGISGGSGSGKSTLVQRILSESSSLSSISLLKHDSYYLNQNEMPDYIGNAMNWDHPEALDNKLFISHLTSLKNGHDISEPVYDYSTHQRTNKTRTVHASSVIIVEGILILAIKEIRDQLDLSVFVETPPEERIVRRILRDTQERNRTVESVVSQFRDTVRPMHNQFVEPGKAHANIIVPWDWGFQNEPAIQMTKGFIKTILNP